MVEVITCLVFLYGTWQGWYGLLGAIVLFFIILGCMQIDVAGFASGCVGLFNATYSLPIVAMLPLTGIIALLIWFAG